MCVCEKDAYLYAGSVNFFLISGLTVATILFGIIRSLLVFQVLVNSGQTLHNKMFKSILKAPVLFFDRNPIGKFNRQKTLNIECN